MDIISTDETLQVPISVGASVEVYRDPYTVIRRQCAEFLGFKKEYYLWDRGLRSAIIPVRDGKVLLTRQYRFLANRITTEIAGGKVESGEEPSSAAIRECFEETGILCQEPQFLIEYHPGLDTYHNPTTIYYSHVTDISPMQKNEKYLWMELDDAIRKIFTAEINDSLSVIGILSLKHCFSSLKNENK